jgi:hypothetical protein
MPTGAFCVSPTGDNSNDGRTWNYPKKDALGAYDAALAGGLGGATILFESGSCWDSANPTRGIQLAGPGDSQWNSGALTPALLAAGWRRPIAMKLEGIPVLDPTGQSHKPTATLNAGSPTDVNRPLLWASGNNLPLEFVNFSQTALAHPVILGLDSTGAGSTNNAFFTFDNIVLRCEQNSAYGPVIDITSAYWLYIRDCDFSCNEQVVWSNDKRPAVLIRGNGIGEGLIWIRDTNFNGGGGVKQYSSGSVNTIVESCVQEGPSTGDLTSGPIYWFASKVTNAPGHAHVRGIEQADAGTRQPAVMVATGNDPSIVVVAGATDVSGPATVLSRYDSSSAVVTTSPQGHRQVGFWKGRVFGRTDAVRRAFAPAVVRFIQRAPHDTSTWSGLSGSCTVTTGRTAPDGTTNAAELSGASGNKTIVDIAHSGHSLAVGDWYVYGAWIKRTSTGFPNKVMQIAMTGAGNLFDRGNGTTATFAELKHPWLGDKDEIFVVDAVKVAAIPTGGANTNLNIYCDTNASVEYFAPCFYHIPTATWSDSEVLAFMESVVSSSSNVRVGDVGLLKGQALSLDGVRFCTNAGTPESVVTAPMGSYCADTTNGEGYIKKTGAGNTGWKLVTHA